MTSLSFSSFGFLPSEPALLRILVTAFVIIPSQAVSVVNVLIAKSDMASVVDSLVEPLSMINALIVATIIELGGAAEETFTRLETIWQEFDVYRNNSEEEKIER